MVCAVEETEKSTLFLGEGGKCDQNTQKSNFTTKCLNTWVAHCSKTDKYRDRAWVAVAVSGKVISPVNTMKQYLNKAQRSHDSPLFCQLSQTKYGYKASPLSVFKALGI